MGNRRIRPAMKITSACRYPRNCKAAHRRPGLLVARHRRGHAQAGIGIDVVGADQSLGQFVEDVIVLGHQLAGNRRRRHPGHAADDVGSKSVGCRVERLIPANALAGLPRPPDAPDKAGEEGDWRLDGALPPLVHSRPRLAGWSGSPRTRQSVASVSISTPQPTPQ